MERELSLTEIFKYLSWYKNKDSTDDLLTDYVMYKSAMSEIPNSLNPHEKKKISEWDSELPNLSKFMDEIGLSKNIEISSMEK